LITAERRPLAPQPALVYALEGLQTLRQASPLVLCPLTLFGEGS
jgi:hypothetical protein